MNKKIWKISTFGIANLVLFVFLMGALLSPFFTNCKDRNSFVFAEEENPLLKSNSIKSAVVLQEAMREIYNEVSPAVVRIETEQTVKMQMNPFFNDPVFRQFFDVPQQQREQKRTGLGSGFVINKEGYIVTNTHVVSHVDKITVKLQNHQSYSAKLIGTDAIADIALLKIDGVKNLKSVYLGDSEDMRVGDFAIAIGNPFGLESTFTMGVISSTGQDIDSADGIPKIQTDAAINPGNSGGPLLNIKGEVIGINQMIYSQSGGSVGIGFAIPMNYAKVVIENLKKGKKVSPGYIGVAVAPQITDDQAKELGISGKKGLLIAQVEVGSPAWKAGLRPYDFITTVEGKEADKFSVLKSTVMRKGSGAIVEIGYIRDKKSYSAKITLAEAPTQPSQGE